MATIIAVLPGTDPKTGIGNLWRKGRRKKDSYQPYYVVRFLITHDERGRYTLTPQPPCTGEPVTYTDMAHLKMYWEWWCKDGAEVDYTKKYE